MGCTDDKTNGLWSLEEQDLHIDCLELLAVLYGLKSLYSELKDCHIRFASHNTTAVHYIENMGGVISESCNDVTIDIWNWCIERNIWVSPGFIRGVDNVEADFLSRHFDERTEWCLRSEIFRQISNLWLKPTVDLFASRLNTHLPKFVSWKPDPNTWWVNAFSINWADELFYAFPPFCLILKCIYKIVLDRAEGMLVVPQWPTQVWWAVVGKTLIQE